MNEAVQSYMIVHHGLSLVHEAEGVRVFKPVLLLVVLRGHHDGGRQVVNHPKNDVYSSQTTIGHYTRPRFPACTPSRPRRR